MQTVYIHGLESSSRGTKGRFFRERFPEMIIRDYSGALENRLAQLEAHLAGLEGLVLVGSSYGGLMAAIFALRHQQRLEKLVLLAPALNFPGLEAHGDRTVQVPVSLYVGKDDTVTPPDLVEPAARRLFPDLAFHLVDDDHLLHRTFPRLDWEKLLGTDGDR